MNKKALEDYALFARNELETQIALSLNKLGIYKDRILKANIVGDLTVIEGTQETFPKRVYELRDTILNSFKLKDENFEHVVEEFAYTWFNRIIAIRFMEVHDYFDHGFKVLTSSDGSYEPDILKNAHFLIDELNLDVNVIQSLKDQNKIEELYRYILFKQCNALNDILPELFDKDQNYMELLLPQNLLSNDSVIRKITSIPEEDFMNDVEVVGWLYQFYNKVKKDGINSSKSKITKDTLPAVTQLFTPDWIIRYMAENSVGRIWLESYPNSPIKGDMKYYVEDAEQTEDVKKKLEEIKYKNVNPEDIKIIEPCCGSGHILVYIFELLFKMYKEKSYNEKDIPGYILKNNLYGLDIDKRAAQLAKFSLIMKARSIDSRFFNKNRFVKPRVFEIVDSTVLLETDYKKHMKNLHFSNESIETAEYLVETFRYAKTIGSLLKVENKNYSALLDDVNRCEKNELADVFENEFYVFGLKELKKLVILAITMCRKYDVMITNPPYRPITDFEKMFRNFADTNYPDSKNDLFSMFMESNYIKENGFLSMINMHSWMFIKSFNKLRTKMIDENFVNVLHLGKHAFDSIPGEFVQTVAFIKRNSKNIDNKTIFIDDTSIYGENEKKENFYKANRYSVSVSNFKYTSGNAFSYWISEKVLANYCEPKLGDNGIVITGMTIGLNDKYLRLWHEVNFKKISLYYDDIKKIDIKKNYWIPYSKGGLRVNWYGGYDYIVNWAENGNFNRSKTTMKDLYLKKAITWPFISGDNITAKILPKGFLWDVSGSPCFFDDKIFNYVLALLVSKVSDIFVKAQNPTNNVQSNDIACIPFRYNMNISFEINNMVEECIRISKNNWDMKEISWDFKINPLLQIRSSRINDVFSEFNRKVLSNSALLAENEKRINELLIKEYDLGDDANSFNNSVELIAIKVDVVIKDFLSYLVGVIMGRYSLEHEGLIYAGGEFDKSKYGDYVDDDGIIPLYEYVGIEDSLTTGICNLVKRIYGDTYYKENLDFIANALDRKPTEGAEEAINRYLNDSFYNDHLKTYQKRPIYWMLSSGKPGAFKCLIYLHRYTKNTLAIINSKYFLPRTAMYKAERERLEEKLKLAELRDKKNIEKELTRIEACEQELLEYGQVLDHVANMCLNDEITIDLDDGVKVNYVKFQNQTLEINGATIKKNLLVPFGLESEKKKK